MDLESVTAAYSTRCPATAGTCSDRYDCPDVNTVDSHIARLRRRLAKLGAQRPDITQVSRADIDRLLDRSTWLTLPVAHQEEDLPAAS